MYLQKHTPIIKTLHNVTVAYSDLLYDDLRNNKKYNKRHSNKFIFSQELIRKYSFLLIVCIKNKNVKVYTCKKNIKMNKNE